MWGRLPTLVVLAAVACDQPGAPEPLNAFAPAPETEAPCAEHIRERWSEQLGVRLPDELPEILWFEGEGEGHDGGCLTYSPEDMPDGWVDNCTKGRYFSNARASSETIHLVANDDDCVAYSFLTHEMLHWALGHATGDTDHDHLGPLWREVESLNVELAVLEGVALPVAPDDVGDPPQ